MLSFRNTSDSFNFDLNITKWYEAYYGGYQFIDKYLYQQSSEKTTEFEIRKKIAYNPPVLQNEVDRILRAVQERLHLVKRRNGSRTYQQMVAGENGGVDYFETNMNLFMADQVLLHLLIGGGCGIFIDNYGPEDLTFEGNTHPFLRVVPRYKITQMEYGANRQFDKVCFENFKFERDSDGQLWYTVYDTDPEKEKEIDTQGQLELSRIPFVWIEMPRPLLRDAADMQIALLNQHSTELEFATKYNFPIYYEYTSPRGGGDVRDKNREIELTKTKGRKVKQGSGPPGYVTPPTENLDASMRKSEQITQLIKDTINSNMEENKEDGQSGLSSLGRLMERAENEVATLLEEYINEGGQARVCYPKVFTLQTVEERTAEAELFEKMSNCVPSKTFRMVTHKQKAETLLGPVLTTEELDVIFKEIEEAPASCVNPEMLLKLLEKGALTTHLVNEILGYPADEADKALEQLADRMAVTVVAQSKAKEVQSDSLPDDARQAQRGEQDVPNDIGEPT
ncbi:MAG: hypothetical protein CL489_06105 [Acidobacteria bacterium]|nr:hypothetical protein [Acidobacteriota bacterium]|tara:strand:+ start:12708 stop:14234 length:1527 start_codon:yes stop_codon:yes gene_type:complete